MKNKTLLICVLMGMIIVAAGCNKSRVKDVSLSDKGPATDSDYENAETVHDLAFMLGSAPDPLFYSDCKDYEDLLYYFDVIGFNQYIKVTQNGKNYILIKYDYANYGRVVERLNTIDRYPSGSSIDINLDMNLADKDNEGCFPWLSHIRLIIEDEGNYQTIVVESKTMEEYDGGLVHIGEKVGLLDGDLNFLIKPVYEGIYDADTSRIPGEPEYYRVYSAESGNGIMDDEFNMVLSPKYSNIYFLSEDRFIVMEERETDNKAERFVIEIIDSDENVLKEMYGFLEPDDSSRFYCHEGHILFDYTGDDQWGKGVIDEDLNVIIEPEYRMVYWLDDYYKVENKNGQSACFDYDGVQYTEFKFD